MKMRIRELYALMGEKQINPKKALRRACQEFESLLWHEVLKGFEATIPRSGLFPENLEAQLYRDLFYQELAREMAGRGTGIADLLYQDLVQKMHLESSEKELRFPTQNAEKGGRDGQ